MKFFYKEIVLIALAFLFTLTNGSRIKRMYALCPPHFTRVGNECYYFSTDRVNWLDAHFDCKDRNSRLAEPIKAADTRLRKHLQHNDESRTDKWIGGIYNWERNKWQWGYNGRDMTYQSFSQMMPGWSARSCVDKHHYVCQHKMPYVSRKNRERVYSKWNETYPNEMANEVEVVINQDDRERNDRLNYRRGGGSGGGSTQARQHREQLMRRGPYDRRTPKLHRDPARRIPAANRTRLRTPRKHVISNDVLKITKDEMNDESKQMMTNDVLQQDPIVEYAHDPNNEHKNPHPNPEENRVDNNVDKEERRRRKQQMRKDRLQRRRRPSTTTAAPLADAIIETTKLTPKITKEEMKKKEEERLRWEREQQRLRETKKLLDEQVLNERRQNEMKRRQDEELRRQQEIIRREEQRKLANKEIDEEQVKKYHADLQKMELLRLEQEKVRQQELRNRQIEERIREDEERKRQEKLAKHAHQMTTTEAQPSTTTLAPTTVATTSSAETNIRVSQERHIDPRIEKKRKEEEDKHVQREKLRAKLQNLSPEKLKAFFELRAERNKKRNNKRIDNEPEQQRNNDVTIATLIPQSK